MTSPAPIPFFPGQIFRATPSNPAAPGLPDLYRNKSEKLFQPFVPKSITNVAVPLVPCEYLWYIYFGSDQGTVKSPPIFVGKPGLPLGATQFDVVEAAVNGSIAMAPCFCT
ncbi:MAG: hypothetical protein BWY22_02278 [Bacteroidetes bacterium ADurb.Bin217]|nr:MAG: hypothetical protein BWY22_02278 [Bacteroidetes bacterium ADurb.Bin217]